MRTRHNVSRIRERAATNPSIVTGANYPIGALTAPMGQYQGHASKRPGGDKGQGLWRTTSPNYRTMVTVDSRWSR